MVPLPTPDGPGDARGARRARSGARGRSSGGTSRPSRWLRPSPRSRRLSLMSSSSMIRRACTLPTPGSDSSTLTTLSLASASSRVPWSNSSSRPSEPCLELRLHLRALTARFGRLLECGLALLGGERRGQVASGDLRDDRRRSVYAGRFRRDNWSARACADERVGHRHRVTSSAARLRIVGAGDRATDHEPVGAARDRVAGRVDARLVVRVATRRGGCRAPSCASACARASVDVGTRAHHAVAPRVARDRACARRARRRSGRS